MLNNGSFAYELTDTNPVSADGENLVFIFGIPRSGTTLLSLILNNHPDVYAPPEPWFLLRLNALRQDGDPASLYDDYQLKLGTREFLNDDVFLKSTRSFAATAYNCHLQSQGKRVFVDKTPRYYHILGFIDTLFPRAKKIWLKRNPFDVATSYRNTWNVRVENLLSRASAPLMYDILLGPKKLSDYFDASDSTKLEIRYEDLVHDPEPSVTTLCRFLDIPFDAGMLSYWESQGTVQEHRTAAMGDKKACKARSIYSTSVEGWKTQLSETEIRQLVQLLGTSVFHRMGYPSTVKWLFANGLLNENPGMKRAVPVSGDVEAFTGTLTREFLALLNQGAVGQSIIIDEIKKIKNFAGQLHALSSEDCQYRKKLLEADTLFRTGHDEAALESLQRLFHEKPSKHDEIINEMLKVLAHVGRKPSRAARALVAGLCDEIYGPQKADRPI